MIAPDRSNMPDYAQLVKFLFQPFLSATDLVGVDCEYTLERQRVWIRVAIGSSDQGTAFGRGGRNIQAIRTVLQAAATSVGQSIHLDVYGSSSATRDRDPDRSAHGDSAPARRAPNGERSSGTRPARSLPTRRPSSSGDSTAAGNGDSPSIPPPRPRR
jgi:uncharacterized protein